MIPDRSEEGEEKGVEAKEGDEVKEEEEEVEEYEIRESGEVETVQRENNSFTGHLVNNFGNEVRTD